MENIYNHDFVKQTFVKFRTEINGEGIIAGYVFTGVKCHDFANFSFPTK